MPTPGGWPNSGCYGEGLQRNQASHTSVCKAPGGSGQSWDGRASGAPGLPINLRSYILFVLGKRLKRGKARVVAKSQRLPLDPAREAQPGGCPTCRVPWPPRRAHPAGGITQRHSRVLLRGISCALHESCFKPRSQLPLRTLASGLPARMAPGSPDLNKPTTFS